VHVDPIGDALVALLRTGAEGYLVVGHSYWPGANHFELISVDGNGGLTGESQIVCRACVGLAAHAVLARIEQLATLSCRRRVPYLDLLGDFDPADGPCSLCGDCL